MKVKGEPQDIRARRRVRKPGTQAMFIIGYDAPRAVRLLWRRGAVPVSHRRASAAPPSYPLAGHRAQGRQAAPLRMALEQLPALASQGLLARWCGVMGFQP